jgi:hypothetical protein
VTNTPSLPISVHQDQPAQFYNEQPPTYQTLDNPFLNGIPLFNDAFGPRRSLLSDQLHVLRAIEYCAIPARITINKHPVIFVFIVLISISNAFSSFLNHLITEPLLVTVLNCNQSNFKRKNHLVDISD